MACANGHTDIVRLLLEANAVSARGHSAKGLEVNIKKHPATALLNDTKEETGCTTYWAAVSAAPCQHDVGTAHAFTPYTRLLVAGNMLALHSCPEGPPACLQNPEAKNADGNTPMHWACLNGHTEVGWGGAAGHGTQQC